MEMRNLGFAEVRSIALGGEAMDHIAAEWVEERESI